MLLKDLVLFFLIIALLRFIFKFVFPVISVTRNVSAKFREMQNQMNEMQQGRQQPQAPRRQTTPSKIKEGDYIDYEEIR